MKYLKDLSVFLFNCSVNNQITINLSNNKRKQTIRKKKLQKNFFYQSLHTKLYSNKHNIKNKVQRDGINKSRNK